MSRGLWANVHRERIDRRASLSVSELERLLAALRDEVERYRYTIRNYPPDRMQRHGTPFLAALERRVDEVQRLLDRRAHGSD